MLLAWMGVTYESAGTARAEKVTNYNDIVSGAQYYIGATTGGIDYYLSVNGTNVTGNTSVAGTAVTSKEEATVFTFIVGSKVTLWAIQFYESGYYLSLKTSKDNGKVLVVNTASTFIAKNQTNKGLLRFELETADYSIQKNNSGTQFGSYGNTQTDIWLEPFTESSPTPSILAGDVDITSDATSGSINYSVTNPVDGEILSATTDADWVSDITVTADMVTFTTTANTGAERTATFTLSYTGAADKEVTVTQAAYVAPAPGTYVKVTSADDLTDGQYLIVYEKDSVAFNGGLETLDAVSNAIQVTIKNNEIVATSATVAAEFTLDMTAGTILSAGGFYIGQTSDANGLASSKETAYTNTISIDDVGDATVIASGGAYLRYNSASDQLRFRYYKSSTYTGQKAIQLYKKVESVEPITVTFNAYGFATFSNGSAVNISEDDDFSAYIITAVGTDNDITLGQVSGDIKAGTGLFLKGKANEEVTIEAAASGEEQEGNILIGFPVSEYVEANTYYGLSGNQFKKVNAGNVKAGKALLPASYVNASNVKPFTFVFEDDVTSIRAAEPKPEDEESAIYNLAGQKVSGKLSKGIYIVNGKKTLF